MKPRGWSKQIPIKTKDYYQTFIFHSPTPILEKERTNKNKSPTTLAFLHLSWSWIPSKDKRHRGKRNSSLSLSPSSHPPSENQKKKLTNQRKPMLEKPPPTPTLITFFLALLFMALSSFLPTTSTPQKHQHPSSRRKRKEQQQQQQKQKPPSSWEQIKGLLTCKQMEGSQVHDPSKNLMGYSKLVSSSCNSICSFRDVVHGNTRVIHREETSPESSSVGQETGLLRRNPVSSESSRSIRSNGGYSSSSRGMHLRRLSGCYECHMIVDPSR